VSPIAQRALVAWPLMAAQMLVFGSAAFELAIAPADAGDRRLQMAFTPWWRVLSLVVLALSPLGLLVATSNMAGVALGKAFPLLTEVMAETHIGRMWAWRLGVAVLLVIAAWVPAQWLIRTTAIFALTAVLLLLGSLSSHAIDKGATAVAIYLLHEMATGLWIGALLGLRLGFARSNRDDRWVQRTAPRVSRVAWWCVAVLAATGIYNAYDALGLSLDHLLYSAYGRILLFKVALFGMALGIAGYNRYRLVPAVEDARARGLLLRNVTVETVLLVGVLGVAALLANTPPAHHH
jgi:copper resistance protein D